MKKKGILTTKKTRITKERPPQFWLKDLCWSLALAALVILLLALREPAGRSFIYAVF